MRVKALIRITKAWLDQAARAHGDCAQLRNFAINFCGCRCSCTQKIGLCKALLHDSVGGGTIAPWKHGRALERASAQKPG